MKNAKPTTQLPSPALSHVEGSAPKDLPTQIHVKILVVELHSLLQETLHRQTTQPRSCMLLPKSERMRNI